MEFYTKLVGVTFKNPDGSSRQDIIEDHADCGQLEWVTLQLEPDNPFDSNAVAALDQTGRQLGFLSRDVARDLAPRILQGQVIRAWVTEITGGTATKPYGVNVRITIGPSH